MVTAEEEIKFLKSLKYGAIPPRRQWEGIVHPFEYFNRNSHRIGHVVISRRGDEILEGYYMGSGVYAPRRDVDAVRAFIQFRTAEIRSSRDSYREGAVVLCNYALRNACWLPGGHWACLFWGTTLRAACLATPDGADYYMDGGIARPRVKCSYCVTAVRQMRQHGVFTWDNFTEY